MNNDDVVILKFGRLNNLNIKGRILKLNINDELANILIENSIYDVKFSTFTNKNNFTYYIQYPYLLIDNVINWNVPILSNNYTISDLIKTYSKGEIELRFEEPCGLGAGYLEELIKWLAANIAGGAIYDLVKYIFNRIKIKYHQNGEDIYNAIICNDNWILDDFCKSFEISDKEQARSLLKGFGYKYDNSKKVYTISKRNKIKAEKLLKKIIKKSTR